MRICGSSGAVLRRTARRESAEALAERRIALIVGPTLVFWFSVFQTVGPFPRDGRHSGTARRFIRFTNSRFATNNDMLLFFKAVRQESALSQTKINVASI